MRFISLSTFFARRHIRAFPAGRAPLIPCVNINPLAVHTNIWRFGSAQFIIVSLCVNLPACGQDYISMFRLLPRTNRRYL